MATQDLKQKRDQCCNLLRKSFAKALIPQGAKRPLGRELTCEVFRHIRRYPNESLPFYLSEILIEVAQQPDRAMVNDLIEYLDFSLSATISESEHKEIWGDRGLEAYKQTNQKHLEDNNQIALLLSKDQADAICCWLKWVKDSSEVDDWRRDQLDGAINYWEGRAQSEA